MKDEIDNIRTVSDVLLCFYLFNFDNMDEQWQTSGYHFYLFNFDNVDVQWQTSGYHFKSGKNKVGV